jgi:hypothetical protein
MVKNAESLYFLHSFLRPSFSRLKFDPVLCCVRESGVAHDRDQLATARWQRCRGGWSTKIFAQRPLPVWRQVHERLFWWSKATKVVDGEQVGMDEIGFLF